MHKLQQALEAREDVTQTVHGFTLCLYRIGDNEKNFLLLIRTGKTLTLRYKNNEVKEVIEEVLKTVFPKGKPKDVITSKVIGSTQPHWIWKT